MATRTPLSRRIQYQEELDPGFADEIAAMPGAEELLHCFQCGTCSAACPLCIYMEHTPRKIMALTRAGFRKEVLTSNTIWLCASCYACVVECPKQISITDVMYALKRTAIEAKVYPKHFPVPVLAREFFRSVRRTGRSNEFWIVLRMFLQTNPLHLLGNGLMGLRLMLRGRMSPKVEKMEGGPAPLARLLDKVDAARPRPAPATPSRGGAPS